MTGATFRSAMRSAGLTVADVAIMSGRAPRTIKSYIYEERAVPDDVARIVGGHPGGRVVAPKVPEPWHLAFASDIVRIAGRQNIADLRLHRKAVAGMCAWCEPDGICKRADCPLRPVSPLPCRP